jgi:hypothetical protein
MILMISWVTSPSLTSITFREFFNQSVNALPHNITHLDFSATVIFNAPLENLPRNITHLSLSRKFNQQVNGFPQTITHLTFGQEFDQPVDKLPPNITHLVFGYHFDQAVDNLPAHITHLTFGCTFNHSVNHLPQSTSHLLFGAIFDQPTYHLPASIKSFTRSIILLDFTTQKSPTRQLDFPTSLREAMFLLTQDFSNYLDRLNYSTFIKGDQYDELAQYSLSCKV